MSRLGFDKALQNLPQETRRFLDLGMKASQKEFKRNFDSESDAETGTDWKAVLRGYPPPILDVTGKLRREALASRNVRIAGNKAVLTIDPYEAERGRPYASYHMEGTKHHPARKFVTQSSSLTKEHKELLDETIKRLL